MGGQVAYFQSRAATQSGFYPLAADFCNFGCQKDIRIFGLQNWLDDLMNNIHDVYLDFRLKVEKKWLIADITEALLGIARNGIAYGLCEIDIVLSEI